jgi:tetratricopeptide (TPR) repeat protein
LEGKCLSFTRDPIARGYNNPKFLPVAIGIYDDKKTAKMKTTLGKNRRLTIGKYVFLCVLCFYVFQKSSMCFGQNRQIDSLLTLLKADNKDTNKVNHLNKLSWRLSNIGNYDTALIVSNQSLILGRELSFKTGIANAYSNIGVIYNNQGKYPEALKNQFAALKIQEQINNKAGIANAYANIGNVYGSLGNYPEALKNQLAGLKIAEQAGANGGIASAYANIGIVYSMQGNYPEALKNYFAALKIFELLGDKRSIASACGNIGSVYYKQGNYPEALKNHFASLKIKEQIGNKIGIANSRNNLGSIYRDQGDLTLATGDKASAANMYAEALKNYFASLKIREEIGDRAGIATSYCNIASLKIRLKDYTAVKKYLNAGLMLSKEIGFTEATRDLYQNFSVLDSVLGNYKSALEHYKFYISYRDSLDNEANTRKTVQQQMQYEFDKKEGFTKAEQEKKDLMTEEEKRNQKLVLWFTVFGLGVVVVVAVFIFRSLRINKKKNRIITMQKETVERQKHIVEEKQKEVLDSIYYARRIQRALITNEKYINKKLSVLNSK